MDLKNAIAAAGGRITSPADMYDSISMEELTIVENQLDYMQGIIDNLSKGAASERISVVLTRSPALSLRIKALDDGSVILLVPIGLIVRARLLATILLTYSDRDYKIRFIASLLDDRPESDWELPPGLYPIFGEFVDGEHHWRLLAELSAERVPDTDLTQVLREVTGAAMSYVVMHEVAHILRGHPGALHKFEKGGFTRALRVDYQEFRRGLELDADDSGAALFLFMVEILLDQLGESDYRP